MNRITKLWIILMTLEVAAACTPIASGADETKGVTVLVAASTKDAITELGQAFERQSGNKVTIVPGPSNALATQIINGAPADLFLSSNQEWADKVKQEGLTKDVRSLLSNGLVIVVPKGNPGKVANPKDLLTGGVQRVALAGEQVPAGKYATQALEAQKVFSALDAQKKIVRGQDVRATLVFVESGEVEAGIVYSTDTKISTKVEAVYTFDPNSYDPIVYPLVLLNQGRQNAAAVKFQEYLLSDQAEKVFSKHGFARSK